MGWVITAGILMVLGIIGYLVARSGLKSGRPKVDDYKDDYTYRREMKIWEEAAVAWKIGKYVAASVVGLSLLILGLNSFTIVPPRNVAVQTQFGRPVDTLDNGFHLIAPWSSIETFDAAVQTLRLSDDKDDNGEPITVRLANASTATVDVTVQWQIDPHADIMPLYLDFRHFDSIDVNVVRRQLASALNDVFATYDPLAAMKSGEKTETTGHLSSTARQQANALLQSGGNLSPEVLFQNCLDMTERMLKEGKAFPIGWTCGSSSLSMTVPVK